MLFFIFSRVKTETTCRHSAKVAHVLILLSLNEILSPVSEEEKAKREARCSGPGGGGGDGGGGDGGGGGGGICGLVGDAAPGSEEEEEATSQSPDGNCNFSSVTAGEDSSFH